LYFSHHGLAKNKLTDLSRNRVSWVSFALCAQQFMLQHICKKLIQWLHTSRTRW